MFVLLMEESLHSAQRCLFKKEFLISLFLIRGIEDSIIYIVMQIFIFLQFPFPPWPSEFLFILNRLLD